MSESYIRHHIKKYFPKGRVDEIRELLATYNSRSPRPDFDFAAFLHLAKGDQARLESLIAQANVDPENVFLAEKNLRSWERVIKTFERPDSFPPVSEKAPLLEFCRSVVGTPIAERFEVGISVDRLSIRQPDQPTLMVQIYLSRQSERVEPAFLVYWATTGTDEADFVKESELFHRVSEILHQSTGLSG
jgi:hypothetical protein